MSEDSSSLTSVRVANTPNAFDLRRVGAHPDYWYPLAWSDELKIGQGLGRRFAGEPIVLYRGKSGQVFALEDRCAHRQVPLHLGVVSGDEIKCHYHGWTYCADRQMRRACLISARSGCPTVFGAIRRGRWTG